MKIANATKLNRKSGGAKPRDLQFRGPFLEMFFDRECSAVEVYGFLLVLTQTFYPSEVRLSVPPELSKLCNPLSAKKH